MRLIQVGVLALVSLVLGLFVLRPLLARPPTRAAPALAAPAPGDSGAQGSVEGSAGDAPAAAGGAPGFPQMQMAQVAIPALDGEVSDAAGNFAPLGGGDPVDRLRRLMDERQEESVEILRGWIEGEKERV